MFDENNMLYILTILEAIEKIFIYSSSFEDEESFYNANQQLNFNAVVNLLIAIGEENKKIDDKLKISQIVNWKNISAMRDKVSHNYRGVDEYIIWDIVKNYLPNLKIALIEIIPKVNNYKKYLKEAFSSIYYKEIKYLEKIFFG